jgi:hypothetical protein
MNRDKIRKMVSDLINEVDYDIWKSIFRQAEESEDGGPDEERIEELVDLASSHINKVTTSKPK